MGRKECLRPKPKPKPKRRRKQKKTQEIKLAAEKKAKADEVNSKLTQEVEQVTAALVVDEDRQERKQATDDGENDTSKTDDDQPLVVERTPAQLLKHNSLPTLDRLPNSQWHPYYKHAENAKARLYVLYGAGATAVAFGPWQTIISREFPELELVVFEYPGHGKNGNKIDLISDATVFLQEFDQQLIQSVRG